MDPATRIAYEKWLYCVASCRGYVKPKNHDDMDEDTQNNADESDGDAGSAETVDIVQQDSGQYLSAGTCDGMNDYFASYTAASGNNGESIDDQCDENREVDHGHEENDAKDNEHQVIGEKPPAKISPAIVNRKVPEPYFGK